MRTFAGPDGAVNDVAFSPDGRYVAAACSNRKVFVFDRDSGEVKGRLELPKVDYQIVGVGFRTPAELILVSDDGKVVIRDWAREANLMSVPLILPGRNAKLAAHAFSAAGDIIAVGGPGTPAYVIFPKSKQASARTLAGGGGGLNGVAISAGGTMVLVSGADARVRVYAFPGGNLLRNLSAEGNDPARAAVFSPDDSRVAAILGSQRVQVWDLRTAERVRSLGHAVHPEFYDLAFTPDGGRLVTVNSFGTLKVWDVESEKPVYESPPSAVAGSQMGPLALSPDGRFAVTGSDRGEVRLWRLPDAD
ncbi:MAG TPA: hypothetical protein VIL46_08410 [Gemmataceae bacterium]